MCLLHTPLCIEKIMGTYMGMRGLLYFKKNGNKMLRGTRPVGSPPVTLRGLMRKDLLLLNGGGGQVHGRRWYQECMETAAWRTSIDLVL
jgi:hypothetical protein